jgi:hypothetical protein
MACFRLDLTTDEAMANKTNGMVHGEISAALLTSRLDIDGYLKSFNELPPGMFKNLKALFAWATAFHMKVEVLDCFTAEQALVVESLSLCLPFRTLWVRVDFEGFRDAMRAFLSGYATGEAGIASVDADHVINRARVPKVDEDDEDSGAWLMLMPVPLGSNRGFGAAIERYLDTIDFNIDCWQIEPVVLLKLFAVDSPRNIAEVKALIVKAQGQTVEGPATSVLVDALERYCVIRDWTMES